MRQYNWEQTKECEQIRTTSEKIKHCLIFSCEIFYVTLFLSWNFLWLKAVNEITVTQIWTSLRKRDVIKVCSKENLMTQIELTLPTSKSWTVQKIMEYLTLVLLSSLWNICHSITAYFLTHPVKVRSHRPPRVAARRRIRCEQTCYK